jgi:hypothetical protein
MITGPGKPKFNALPDKLRRAHALSMRKRLQSAVLLLR